MDPFLFPVNTFCLASQGTLQLIFTGALTGNRPRARHFVFYLCALGLLEWAGLQLNLPALCAIGAEFLILYGTLRLLQKNRRWVSCVAAVLALYLTQLSFGVVDSAETLLFFRGIPDAWIRSLVLLSTLAALALCTLCCIAALRLLRFTDGRETEREDGREAGGADKCGTGRKFGREAGDEDKRETGREFGRKNEREAERETMPLLFLLLPELFFFSAQLYILNSAYQVLSLPLSSREIGKHTLLFILQVLGLAAALCTLYAYRRIRRGYAVQAALDSYAQAAAAQKIYLAEAQTRYEQTRAFRHDLQNHLSVLGGLLNSGKTDEGRDYLQKLTAVSASLSLPCHTGDPVADIILGEKLGMAKAKGITAELALALPGGLGALGLDAPDLCVILANALDNALHACDAVCGEKWIRIRGVRQGDFYLLTVENSCVPGPTPPMGTGLSNIRAAMEKYGGAMRAEKNGGIYSLDLLLNIS